MRILSFMMVAFLWVGQTHAQTSVRFIEQAPATENIAVGVYENGELGTVAASLDAASNGALSDAISRLDFKGKLLSTATMPAPMGISHPQIMLIGLGAKGADLSDTDYQKAGGKAAQAAIKAFGTIPAIAIDGDAEALANFAYGAKLGAYSFDTYYKHRTDKHKGQESIRLVSGDNNAASLYQASFDPVANAIYDTRDISNHPANTIYPESFVSTWRENLRGLDVTIKVIDEKQMQEMGMGAIYGVGRGSHRPPRMMIVEYMGAGDNSDPVVIAGKGITFDTGGIGLKNPPNMWNMKNDMSGAASAMGTIKALAGRGAKVNAVGIAALAENMPGGNAQRPGDIVTNMSGKTIEIRSTDAEGRLVLSDAMSYAQANYKPALLVDLATLTGSASRALGKDYAALFSRHQNLADMVNAAGKASLEEVWQLPLNANHFRAIESNIADVMNSGPSAPGASAGAAFIGAFVKEDVPWVHLDIAGVAYGHPAKPTIPDGHSAGFGVRLLNKLIMDHYEK